LFAAENATARKSLKRTLDVAGRAEVRRSSVEATTGGALTFDETTWSFDKPFSQKVVRDAQFVVVE
ncbi:MAG: hypothetical protein AABY13_04075, partial [Nanoarchaeota archaeon]